MKFPAAAAAVLSLWLVLGGAAVRGKRPDTQHVLELLKGAGRERTGSLAGIWYRFG